MQKPLRFWVYVALILLLAMSCMAMSGVILWKFDHLLSNGKLVSAIIGLAAMHLSAFVVAMVLKAKAKESLGLI